MLPNVRVRKVPGGASPALRLSTGVLLILAGASTGPILTPTQCTTQDQLTANFAFGPLPEYGAYNIQTAGLPVVATRCNTSVAASYGTVVHTGVAGTCVPSAGGTSPYEHYNVVITVVAPGTVGAAGITYTYSLDGGTTTSSAQALGTSTVLTIPNTGVSFALAAGTLLANDNWSCFTERALMNNADLTAAIAAVNQFRGFWEGALIDCAYSSGTVGLLDAWLSGRETNGQFNFFVINTRFLTEPTPSGETPSTYAAAMTALTGGDASNRGCVCVDGGHVASEITGWNLKRPTALALCAMAMSVTPNIKTSPSYVGLGAVPGFSVTVNSSPNDWDESNYGGSTGLLDNQRLVTLRTFPAGGPVGVFITHPNIFIASPSNITFLQFLRVLNVGCTVAWQTLNTVLQLDVNTIFDAPTGNNYIEPASAQAIEAVVNDPLAQALKGQATNQKFILHRDDPLNTAGAPLTADVQVQGKFYIDGVNVNVALVKTISAPLGGV